MTVTIQPPQPGDLITSSFMKQLIDTLTAMDARISSLEGVVPGAGGALAILQMSPTDLTQGDELRIYGLNFGLPSENTVTFNSANPTNQFKAGSGDTLLILDVPLFSLASDAQLVNVAVSSARGSDFRQITIRKPQATLPGGTLAVGITAPGGNISGTVVFIATIDARSTLDETFNLTPTVPAVASGKTPWQVSMVTDATGATTLPKLSGGPNPPPWQMLIPKPANGVSTVVQAFIKVVIPGDNAVALPFVNLDVKSSRNPNGFSGGNSGNFGFTVGQPAPANQTLKFGAFTAINGTVSSNTATFPLPIKNLSRFSYSIPSLAAGTYQLSIAFAGNSNGWVATFQPGQTLLVKTFTLNPAGDDTGEQIFISGSPTGPAVLNITVTTPLPAAPAQPPTANDLKNATAYGVFQMTLTPG